MTNDIKGYKNLLKIAKGGMGEVYKAVHNGLNKEVILKKLQTKAPKSFTERFKREASIMMEVSHPNIVHIFDYFKEGNTSYIAMEYIEGSDLARLLKKHKKFPIYMAAYIIYEVAKGLQHAHDKEITHRDIKPGNVLISKKGEIKLTDFGIAFKTDRKKGEELTKTGTLLGTPAYMSPEQIHSSKDVDSRSDIYSLGILFYELLTGSRPYSNEFTMDNITKIRKGHYPSVRSKNGRVPSSLVRIIKKAMSPRKSRRFQTIGALIRRLEPFLLRKFKSLKSMNNLFAQFINGEEKSVMAKFEYPLYKMLTFRALKLSLAIAGAAALLNLGALIFPTLFVKALPGRYGVVEISFSEPANLIDDTIRLTSAGGSGRSYRIPTWLYRPLKYKIKRMLPVGSYRVDFSQAERELSGNLIISPAKESPVNILTLNTDIKNIPAVTIVAAAKSRASGKSISNFSLKYRVYKAAPPLNEWQPLRAGSSIPAGESYDLLISANGYNDSLLSKLKLRRTMNILELDIEMTPQMVTLSLPAIDASFSLKIDGKESGSIDAEGIKRERYKLDKKSREFYLSPGRHKIELLSKNKVLFSKSFNINRARSLLLNFKADGAPYITVE